MLDLNVITFQKNLQQIQSFNCWNDGKNLKIETIKINYELLCDVETLH
jgi:hypothetical protein